MVTPPTPPVEVAPAPPDTAGVVSEEATDDGVRLVALVPDRLRSAVEPFIEGDA